MGAKCSTLFQYINNYGGDLLNLTLQTQLVLCPLIIKKDKKHYIIEEQLSGEYFEMPKICVDAIEFIQKGESLSDIESMLQRNYPTEDVDMVDFAEQLVELGLVLSVDGEEIKSVERIRLSRGFTWIPTKVARLLFNKVTYKIYVILFLINIAFFVTRPELIPHYGDIFIFDSMVMNIVVYMFISLFLIMIHEFGHIVAIRAHDLPAKLDIGNRLFLIVFETDLTTAWKLSPKERNGLYLAGIAMEQTIVFIAISLLFFMPGEQSIFIDVLGLVIFDIFIKTIYQCCIYMKTDLYYLIENMTSCYNLMENGKQYLSKWIPILRTESNTQIYKEEMKTIRLYSGLYICGYVLTIYLFVKYFLPQLFYTYSYVFSNLGTATNRTSFWDAVVILGQTILMLGLLLYTIIKKRDKETSKI